MQRHQLSHGVIADQITFSDAGSLVAGHRNGFLHRRIFAIAGTYNLAVPADLPVSKVRIKGLAIGAGAGGDDANAGGSNGSGAGGGYSHKTIWVSPGQSVTVVVGAAGQSQSASPGNRAGGTTSFTVGDASWQATGGQNTAGGVGSGGDVNANGGDRTTTPANDTKVAGASAGSPWSNGRNGAIQQTPVLWQLPTFWDLEDFAWQDNEMAAVREITGIGSGGYHDGTSFQPATFGGGGCGGWQSSRNGGGGLAILYW